MFTNTFFILLHLDLINQIPNTSTTAEAHIGILLFIWIYNIIFCK